MKDSPSPTGNIVTSLIFFGVTAAIAIILFIDAFVMWLASLTGSVAVAALITGGFFAVIAAVVYLLAVRSALNYVRSMAPRSMSGLRPSDSRHISVVSTVPSPSTWMEPPSSTKPSVR